MSFGKNTLILLCSICVGAASAQNNNRVQVPTNPTSPGVVKIDVIDSPIIMSGYDGNIVEFEAVPDDPAKRKGFEDLIFGVLKSGNDVIITSHDRRSKDISLILKIPKFFSVEIKTVYGAKVQVENVNGSISVYAHAGNILLTNVPGSLDLYSAKGDIVVNTDSFSGEIPTMITNVYGDIKLILPPTIKATLTINSFGKKMNSEFKLQNQYKEVPGDLQKQAEILKSASSHSDDRETIQSLVDSGVTKSINGGGPMVLLRLHSGTLNIIKRR